MNPEFLRNSWIEATPRRLFALALVLALLLLGAFSIAEATEPGSGPVGVFAAAQAIGGVLLCFWGARNAAEGVLGEIKDHTWDFQRLSSLSPLEMTFGKLFGPTLYVWCGGAICAGAMLWGGSNADQGPMLIGALPAELNPWYDVAKLALSGLIAQSAALTVALAFARGGGRIGAGASAAAMACGLTLAWAIYVGASAFEAAAVGGRAEPEPLSWWGLAFADPKPFILASYCAFAGWTALAAWRLMRRELQVPSTPWAFALFAAFLASYAAGFFAPRLGEPLSPALAAYAALHVAALAAALLEPKNATELRALFSASREKGAAGAIAQAPAYAIGLVAATLAAIGIAIARGGFAETEAALALAAAGLLARDVAVIVAFALAPDPRRSAFAALVTLGLLYGVAAPTAASFGAPGLFVPTGESAAIISAWAQAGIAFTLLSRRLRRVAKSALINAPV